MSKLGIRIPDQDHAEHVALTFKERDKKKKKKTKRRFSSSLMMIGLGEQLMAKASYRLAKALERGVSEYHAKSDKSAHKRKNGALRDFIVNAIRGMSKTLSQASKVPVDLVKVVK